MSFIHVRRQWVHLQTSTISYCQSYPSSSSSASSRDAYASHPIGNAVGYAKPRVWCMSILLRGMEEDFLKVLRALRDAARRWRPAATMARPCMRFLPSKRVRMTSSPAIPILEAWSSPHSD
ncbi:hypothetical protein GUJ93_ZPchr0001g33122 [Zizania palustris]|uniref:Uncharacterized protein n=1 Tax=Zizania palustris TaxID=103762 RepID=A0A8J5RRI2_ZIZPA|nr:hypothetical protein GUJ93_ZPchr0001g33122 [Zizania palustris]